MKSEVRIGGVILSVVIGYAAFQYLKEPELVGKEIESLEGEHAGLSSDGKAATQPSPTSEKQSGSFMAQVTESEAAKAPVITGSEREAADEAPAPGFHRLTAEEEEELMEQHQEALQAELGQLDEMIQSLEVGGASEDQITHFRELKSELEREVIDSESVLPSEDEERTDEDLFDDFVASIEGSDLPEEEIDRMISSYEMSFEAETEFNGYTGSGPVPPERLD